MDWLTLRGSHPSKTVLLPPGWFFRFYIINITWKELIWKILTQNWLCPKDFWIDSLYEGHIPQNLRQCFIPSPILLIFPFYIISNFFWKKSYCITALLHYCQKKAPQMFGFSKNSAQHILNTVFIFVSLLVKQKYSEKK